MKVISFSFLHNSTVVMVEQHFQGLMDITVHNTYPCCVLFQVTSPILNSVWVAKFLQELYLFNDVLPFLHMNTKHTEFLILYFSAHFKHRLFLLEKYLFNYQIDKVLFSKHKHWKKSLVCWRSNSFQPVAVRHLFITCTDKEGLNIT